MEVDDLFNTVESRKQKRETDWADVLGGALSVFSQAEMDYWGSLLTAEIAQGVQDGSITSDEGEQLLKNVNAAETVEELQDMVVEGGIDLANTNEDGR